MGPRLSRHVCLFTLTRGSLADKAPAVQERLGPSGARGGEAARTQTCMTFPGGCPRPGRPAHQPGLLSRGGCGHVGLWESSPWGARDPGMGRRRPEPPDPPQASSGARTGPLRQAGWRQALEPSGGRQQGQMDADGRRAKIIRIRGVQVGQEDKHSSEGEATHKTYTLKELVRPTQESLYELPPRAHLRELLAR